jgi:hypothetical protein
VHLCLRQFRVDTLITVQAEIHPDYRETALNGLRLFSYTYLEETMDYGGLHLVSGNKSAFKDLCALKEALFGYNDARKRTHWENKPYRTPYRRACVTLSAQPATAAFGPENAASLYSSVDVFCRPPRTANVCGIRFNPSAVVSPRTE